MTGDNRPSRRAAASTPAAKLESRYGTTVTRNALAPGLLGAIALVAGTPLLGADGFIVIRYAAAILALIVAVFAWQARRVLWLPLLAGVAVVWNPIVPIPFQGGLGLAAQFVGAAALALAGLFIRGTEPDTRSR